MADLPIVLTTGEAGGLAFAAHLCGRDDNLLVVERDDAGTLLATADQTGRRFTISSTGYVEEVGRVD